LIICQTRKQAALLFCHFSNTLKRKLFVDNIPNARKRIIEMFHAGTPSEVKEHVINDIVKGF